MVIIVVTLGQLPGQIAIQRNHPQAAAINITGWLGVATLGILWPLAMIWAFMKPFSAAGDGSTPDESSHSAPDPDPQRQLANMQAQVDNLQVAVNKLHTK